MKISIIGGLFIYISTVLAGGVVAEGVAEEIPPHIAGDIIYGDPAAPVEIVEYASFTCPHCAHFAEDMIPFLKEKLIPEGKVKLVFRNFIRDRLDMAVAVVSRCTADMEKTKRLTEAFFKSQQEWMTAESPLVAISSIAYLEGLSLDEINSCLASAPIREALITDMKAGMEKYEISAVPTIIINGTKTKTKDYDELKEKIALAAGGQ